MGKGPDAAPALSGDGAVSSRGLEGPAVVDYVQRALCRALTRMAPVPCPLPRGLAGATASHPG
eukprot:4500008-Alexandrium_andersonii.AAC.1